MSPSAAWTWNFRSAVRLCSMLALSAVLADASFEQEPYPAPGAPRRAQLATPRGQNRAGRTHRTERACGSSKSEHRRPWCGARNGIQHSMETALREAIVAPDRFEVATDDVIFRAE